MRSWMLDPSRGVPEQVERDLPEPGPHQILVEVRAASLNRGEFLAGAPGVPRPCGMEAAGTVLACGRDLVARDGSAAWLPGTRVMGRTTGGFATHALIEGHDAMEVPEGLSWEQAGAIPIAYLVAYDMLVLGGQLGRGQWLLIAGVSSGVGVACLQMGKVLGAKVIGTSGSAHKLARLADHGLDLGICARGGDFVAQVRDHTHDQADTHPPLRGPGVHLAVNNVGGSAFAACLAVLRFQGRLAQVGFVDGVRQGAIDLDLLHSQRLHVFGVSNRLRTAEQRAATVRSFSRDMLAHVHNGSLRPLVDQVFAFDELPQAHQMMLADRHVGKLVLRMDAPRA